MGDMKIAMVFPFAPSYREPIYQLMDKSFNIDWYFCGNATRNMKIFDYKLLKHCNLSIKEKHIIGPITYYSGLRNIDFRQYDVVICSGVIRCLSESWLLQKVSCHFKGKKLYLWTHGWYGKESKIQSIIKKIFFRKVDGFLLYGDYARGEMLKKGFDANKLFVIKNSLDYDKQLELRKGMKSSSIYKEHFENDNPNIVFVGRLTAVKKLNQLIDAVSLLQKKGDAINVTFVGDGEMKQALQQLVLDKNLEKFVWFYGASYDETNNAELIYNADLCVAPGNIGLTAMHALMFGCPAISHNDYKWQMPEFEAIKPGVTGDFFERDNVESLANCISNWFKSKENCRENIRQQCYQEIDNCWNPHYQLSVLKSVLEIGNK